MKWQDDALNSRRKKVVKVWHGLSLHLPRGTEKKYENASFRNMKIDNYSFIIWNFLIHNWNMFYVIHWCLWIHAFVNFLTLSPVFTYALLWD
jgi:hypothetical protein